jgi:glutamine synthetase
VLVDYVSQGSLTLAQAKQAAIDILFDNSNKLYNLNLPRPEINTSRSPSTAITKSAPTGFFGLNELATQDPSLIVWMQWVDYTATVRVRMFPLREFIKIVQGQRRIGITLAALHLLQDDHLAPGGSATGQFYMRPDMSTFIRNVALNSNSATVMTFWEDENGVALEGCPRTTLQRVVKALEPIQVTLGFEIEVVFLRKSDNGDWVPLTQTHSWSNMTADIRQNALSLAEEIVSTLASIDIYLEQFHAESAPGQFEFILPPNSPLAAVDTLLKARATVQHVAEKKGFRATLYPRPYNFAAGTASHAHFSISPASHQDSFLAGILAHFSSVAAFSLSQEISYARVASGVWAGSEWVTWGTQNREAPIRKIFAGHWEFKSIDGLANMYLAMSALLGAGYIGVSRSMPLLHGDCPTDAATLSAQNREELGIVEQIPKTLEQSLSALEFDRDIQEIMGPAFVKRYCAVKRAEAQNLAALEEGQRREWLMSRY